MGAVESLRNEVLDKILSGTNFTTQATHISLHTADPGTSGTNELSGGSYARQSIAFNAAASGQADNAATITFDGPASSQTVTHVGLWTAASGGTFLWKGSLTSSKTFGSGDTLEFAAGAITVPTSGA